jgi:hypothetical protein
MSKMQDKEKLYVAKILADQAINWFNWPDAEQRKMNYELRKDFSKIKVVFSDCATIVDQDNIKNLYEKFWLEPKFAYSHSAMKNYAKEFKSAWFSKIEYMNRMKELGVKDNVEPYFS